MKKGGIIIFIIKDTNELHGILKKLCSGKHSVFPNLGKLEKALGMSSGTISKYKTTSPSLANVIRIANALDMEVCFCTKYDLDKIHLNHSIISDLDDFFNSKQFSDEEKTALESKIKDLLYEETKKIL